MYVNVAANFTNFEAGLAKFTSLEAGVRKIENSLGGLSSTASSAGGAISTALGTFAGAVGAQALLGSLKGVLGGVVGGAFEMNATLESTTLQFATLMGSSDGAREHVKDLFEFAKKTPFETGPIIQASKMMRTFGGDALDTKENLKLIGDASAATGAPIDELGKWVGRMYASLQAGKPFGESAARLSELAVMTPQARGELEQMQKAGKSADEIFGAFQKNLGAFTGAMDAQAGTWSGVTSTFSDSVNMLMADSLKPLFEMARDGLKMLNEVMASPEFEAATTKITEGIKSAFGGDSQAAIQSIAGFLLTMADAAISGAGLIGQAWSGLQLVFSGTASILTTVGHAFTALISGVADIAVKLPGVGDKFTGIQGAARGLNDQMRGMQQSFHDQAEEALQGVRGNGAWQTTMDAAHGTIGVLRDGLGKMTVTTGDGTEAVKKHGTAVGAMGKDQEAAAKAAEAHEKAIKGLTEKLTGQGAIKAANDMVEALKLMPGVGTLTKDSQVEIAKTMEAAMLVYKAAGTQIPEDWKHIAMEARAWSKTMSDDTKAEMTATTTALAEPFKKFEVKVAEMRIPARDLSTIVSAPFVEAGQHLSTLEGTLRSHGVVTKAELQGQAATAKSQFEFMRDSGLYTSGQIQTAWEDMATAMAEAGTPLKASWSTTMTDLATGAAGALSQGGLKGVQDFGKQTATDFAGSLLKTVPIVGETLSQLAGPLIDIVGGFFKKIFGTAGRDAVLEFSASFGGFDDLHAKLGTLGAAGEQLWIKLTQGVGRSNPEQAKAVIAEITAAFDKQKESVEALRTEQNTQLGDLLGQLGNLKGRIPETLDPYIAKLTAANLLTKDNAALLATLRGDGELDWKAMEQVAKKYGIALEGLGPQFQSSKLHAGAQELWDDYQLLITGGGDVGAVLEGMSGSIGKLVSDSLKFGVDIPENFKPLIRNLIDADKLILDNGTHVKDFNTLKFGTSIQTSIETLVLKIGELIDKMIGPNGVAAAIGKIPTSVVVDVEQRFRRTGDIGADFPDPIVPESFSNGGMVGTGRIIPFAMSTGGMIDWSPQGVDTVPAMLQAGEAKLNPRAAAALGAPRVRREERIAA